MKFWAIALLLFSSLVSGMEQEFYAPSGYGTKVVHTYFRLFCKKKSKEEDTFDGQIKSQFFLLAFQLNRNLRVNHFPGTDGLMSVDLDGNPSKDKYDEKTGKVPEELLKLFKEKFLRCGFESVMTCDEYEELLSEHKAETKD